MIEFITSHLILMASLCAGLCVTFATYVIVDFMAFTSARYKEKYLQEAAVEMDDVLLQLPPGRILDLSLALSAIAAFWSVGLLCLFSERIEMMKLVFFAGFSMLLAFPAPRLYLRYLKKQRLAKFNEQLEDALLAMSSSLKAGFSINQAFEVIAGENRKPISFEFNLLIQELRLGVPFEQALQNMNNRMQCADLELVTIAIITARQTGGELTSILERLAGVIRERVRITQRIHSLTAQGRLQAWLIGAMPFFLMFAMSYIAPDMMNAFFSSVLGVIVIIGVILMVIAGFFSIRKITTIDI